MGKKRQPVRLVVTSVTSPFLMMEWFLRTRTCGGGYGGLFVSGLEKGHAHRTNGACKACNVERALPWRPELRLTKIMRTADLVDVLLATPAAEPSA